MVPNPVRMESSLFSLAHTTNGNPNFDLNHYISRFKRSIGFGWTYVQTYERTYNFLIKKIKTSNTAEIEVERSV